MTEQEFNTLRHGDVIHHPATPIRVWTVIGYQPHLDSFLAVRGRPYMAGQHLWLKLLRLPESKCQELAKRSGLNITRIINPGNWLKKYDAPTFTCQICGTTTPIPHVCPVFYPELRGRDQQ